MKKWIALLLALVCALEFATCASQGAEYTSTEPETDPPVTIDNDAEIKAELMEKYGGKFKFYLAFDMQLILFVFDDTTVKREHYDSMKNDVPTHSATWDIVDGELVVTGEWNEAFILDLEANIAISKTDGREYPIYAAE